MSDSNLVRLHVPSPFVRLRPPDFRLRTDGTRVYVTPVTRAGAAWLDWRVGPSSDAEWSDGSLVLHREGASAFVEAVHREGLEVSRSAKLPREVIESAVAR